MTKKGAPFKHSGCGTRLYRIFKTLITRCTNPKRKDYKHYGGRGITICEEWRRDFAKFRDWAHANGYQEALTLDRIDNDEGYSPDNCRWILQKLQHSNRRSLKNSSGFIGVHKKGKRWISQISINYKVTYLGTFDTPEEASLIYEKAKKERDKMYLEEGKFKK